MMVACLLGGALPGHSSDADVPEEPDSKRARLDESEEMDSKELHYLLDDADFGYIMELDLEFASHRKLKRFLHSPSDFLVQQLRDTEVLQHSRMPKQPPTRCSHRMERRGAKQGLSCLDTNIQIFFNHNSGVPQRSKPLYPGI